MTEDRGDLTLYVLSRTHSLLARDFEYFFQVPCDATGEVVGLGALLTRHETGQVPFPLSLS